MFVYFQNKLIFILCFSTLFEYIQILVSFSKESVKESNTIHKIAIKFENV